MVIGYWAGTCHTLHSNRPFLQKEEENQQKSSCLGRELPWTVATHVQKNKHI